jgi:hypothetical protein
MSEIGDPVAQGEVRDGLGLVQQLTGDYQAAAASHQQALQLMREAGGPYGQARVLNSLGELASRTMATGQAREHHSQALTIARKIGAPCRRHMPLRESATATCKTATPARQPRTSGTLSPSTSASEPQASSVSGKPCANTGSSRPTPARPLPGLVDP